MSWSSLHDAELVDVILAKVSLIELAPITTTCSSFRAAFWSRMAPDQEARRQLADNTFGAARITCVLALMESLLKREPLPPGYIDGEWKRFGISALGVLYGPISGDPNEIRDVRVSLYREGPTSLLPHSNIYVGRRNGREPILRMNISHQPHFSTIEVNPTNDEDLLPVALMQAVLSEGLARIIRDVGHHAMVHITRPFWETGFTQAGLKAQIVPLLPFASHYTSGEARAGEPLMESMQIGQW